MPHPARDPQVDLVRRYARILRSAPAEALRAQKARTFSKAAAASVSVALADPPRTPGAPRARRPSGPA